MDFLRNLDFFRSDSDALVSPQFVVMAIAFGLIIAFIIVYYNRQVIGSFVRAIRDAEAVDEASAKTLSELGQSDNISAISKLKRSTSLQAIVTICGAATTEKGKMVFDENTRFYIAKTNEERARKQFGNEKDSLLPIILGSVALIIVVVLSFLIGK